jgi:hypothetical protein
VSPGTRCLRVVENVSVAALSPEEFQSHLYQRGMGIVLRNNRLGLKPGDSWKLMSNEERAYWRDHRDALKELASRAPHATINRLPSIPTVSPGPATPIIDGDPNKANGVANAPTSKEPIATSVADADPIPGTGGDGYPPMPEDIRRIIYGNTPAEAQRRAEEASAIMRKMIGRS